MNTQEGILQEKQRIVELQNNEIEIRKRLESKTDSYINNVSEERFPLLTVLMTAIELEDNRIKAQDRKRRLLSLRLDSDIELVAKASDRNQDTIQELMKSVNSAVDSVSENRKDISQAYMWLFWAVLSGSVSIIMNILNLL